MFRRLRTKIIVSFCLLMAVGGTVTTAIVGRTMWQALSSSVERDGAVFSRMLSAQLSEPIAYRDRLAARRLLVHARDTHPDLAYAFVVSVDGHVTDHSFPTDRFPTDLLPLASTREPSTLRAEAGLVRDIPCRIAEGVLGTVHVGISTARAEEETFAAVRGVLVTTAAAMAAGVLGILFLASLITRPLLALAGAARRIGSGDYAALAPVVGRDELSDVAVAFNQMARQVRDRIAESEELRAYIERVLDHMDSAIVVASEGLEIEYANRVARDRYGSVVGRVCSEALGTERPCDDCPAAEVLASGKPLHRSFRSPAGRTYELTYLPMVGRGGRRAVVEKSVDVTERRELADRMQRTERLAVAGEIAAGVVHAVNNPLDGVRRALDLAGRDLDDRARVTRMLGLASEGTERIAHVTRTLLGFARTEAHPTRVPVAAATIADGAVELVRLRAHSRSVDVRASVGDDLPSVRVDPHAIKEVLVNLLLNAVDACRPGGAVVVEARMSDADTLEISVRDDGSGIAPEDLARIFEPFFTTKAVGHGTGLGLSVARRIVESHGGEIGVESTPGVGSSFRVRLPVRDEPPAQDGAGREVRA
jgi:signal transduction histidine kinase